MLRILIAIVLIICFGYACGADEDVKTVQRKTGNLSIISYRHAVKVIGTEPQVPDPLLVSSGSDLTGLNLNVEMLRHMGAMGVEDYPTLDIIMPEKGDAYFDPFLANAKRAKELGLEYAIYPWVHFYPDWVENEPGFVAYTNLDDGSSCRQPSGWAPFTMELTDLYYKAMAEHLGEYVDGVYVTDCAEYGELGYPIGYTQWLRPDPNARKTWWCGDEYARRDFRESITAQFGNYEKLNERWGTSFSSDNDITYPPNELLESNPNPRELSPENRHWILDFVYWYQDAGSRRMRAFTEIAKRHFPDRYYEIKLGHAEESALAGHSHSSVCRALGGISKMSIRSTHASVGYFHVKRVATPARFYGFGFLTEPPGTVPPEKMAERIFTDACAGVDAYFDYPQNPAASEDFPEYIELLDARPAHVDVALFFAEADLYLHIDKHYPDHLIESAHAIRDIADFDVVDERLIADGVLENYSILVVIGDPMIERSTWDGLAAALQREAPLHILQIASEEIATEAGEFLLVSGELDKLPVPEGSQAVERVIGLPKLYTDPSDDNPAIKALQVAYREVLKDRGLDAESIALLTTRDGIWAGVFDHRFLLFNTMDMPQEVAGKELGSRKILEILR